MNALNPVRTIGSRSSRRSSSTASRDGAAARARTGELLESVGIPASGPSASRTSSPAACASGRRSRWRSSCNPKVLIADEPTTALDVMVQAQILELLDALCREFGLALILVTHDLPVVAQLCDRAAVMYAGEIVESGRVDDAVPRAAASVHAAAVRRDTRPRRSQAATSRRFPARRRGSTARSTGCPFRPRCDSAFEPCAAERPALLQRVGAEHAAACHLNDRVTVPA